MFLVFCYMLLCKSALPIMLPVVLQSWTKGCRQIHKVMQIRLFYGMFYSYFLRFFTETRQNLAFGWPAGYSPSRNFLETTHIF